MRDKIAEVGELITIPLSTYSLEQIIIHLTHFPEDRKRIGELIKKYYNYTEEEEEVKRNIEGILEPFGLTRTKKLNIDPKGLRIEEENGKKYLRYKKIKIRCKNTAPDSIEDVPASKKVSLVPTNLRVIEDILKDIYLKQHLQLVGERGTGKDVILQYLHYLIYGDKLSG
jgi:hypothetical protein